MAVKARIYRPAKTAMQSGRAKIGQWVLEYPRASRVGPDRLMGWQSSSDTGRQVRLRFADVEAAIAYAEKHNIPFELARPQIILDEKYIIAAGYFILFRIRRAVSSGAYG